VQSRQARSPPSARSAGRLFIGNPEGPKPVTCFLTGGYSNRGGGFSGGKGSTVHAHSGPLSECMPLFSLRKQTPRCWGTRGGYLGSSSAFLQRFCVTVPLGRLF